MAARARPCVARTRLVELIYTPNGRCAPSAHRSFAASNSSAKNINILFPETKASFKPEHRPPGGYIFPLDYRGQI
ncbi:MAG: hypothetical protein ACK559_35395 [bacterium]